ncbi:hypothetical protein ES703_59705 [subsurface metagenome]
MNLVSFIVMVIASFFPIYSYTVTSTWSDSYGTYTQTRVVNILGIVYIWPTLLFLLIANILILAKTAKVVSAILALLGNLYLIFILLLVVASDYDIEIGWIFLFIMWVISLLANIFLFTVKYGRIPKQIYQQPIQQQPIQQQPTQEQPSSIFDKAFTDSQRCPKCGAEAKGEFCTECGTQIK